MIEPQNFYTSGGTLGRSARSYVTRSADDDLLRHILNGDFCYVLTSRQMGKSSLMVRTADTLRKQGVNVAILDLTRIGQNVSPEQWYDGLLVRLGADLNLEDELDEYWNSDGVSRQGPMQRFMGALREVILPSVKGRVSIFVDEIDSVRSLPFSSDEFFAGIRECYNRRVDDPEFKRLSFCLLGVAQPSDLISNVYITPFNIGHRIELTDFSEAEAQPLLEGLRNASAKPGQAETILHRVLYWTGGHPYLTQKLCETLGRVENDVTPGYVDRACAEMFLSSRSREQQDNLIFVRDRVLASTEHRAAILDLYERVLRGGKVPDDDSNAIIDSLRLSGLLVVSNGCLKVRNRIYATVFDRHWITKNMPDAELRRQRRAFRKGITIATGIAALVLGVIGWLWSFTYKEGERLQHEVGRSSAASMTQAQQEFDIGNYGWGTQMLLQQIVPNGHPERGFEWYSLWARFDGENATTYFGHWDEVRSVAISPDGALAVTGGADSTVRIFELHQPCSRDTLTTGPSADEPVDPNPPTSIPCFRLLRSLIVDMNGAVSYSHGDPRWKDRVKLTNRPESGVQPSVMAIRFSPDGAWIAIATGYWGSNDLPGNVYLWRTSDGHVFPVNTRHKGVIKTVAISKNLELATGGIDGTAEFFKIMPDGTVSEEEKKETSDPGRAGGINAAAFSSNGRYYAMAFNDGRLDVKDMETTDAAFSSTVVDASGLQSVTFYNDPVQHDCPMLVGSKDGHILQVDCRSLVPHLVVESGQGIVMSLTISEDRKVLISAGTNSTLKVWRLKRRDGDIEALDPKMLGGHRDKVFEAAITPDPNLIVSVSADKSVRFWALQKSMKIAESVALAPKLSGPSPGQQNQVGEDLTADSRTEAGESPDYASHPQGFSVDGAVRAVAFNPVDGRQLVYMRGLPEDKTATGTEVFFYDLKNRGEPLRRPLDGHGYGNAIAYSSDGKYVATGTTDGTVSLWDTTRVNEAEYEPTTLEMPKSATVNAIVSPIAGLAFSPGKDGTLAASNGQSIILWKPHLDASGERETYGLVDHFKRTSSGIRYGALAFSPKGEWIAVCTADRSDAENNKALEVLIVADLLKGDERHVPGTLSTAKKPNPLATNGPCNAVAFSHDAKWLAAGTISRQVAVWNVIKWVRVEGERYELHQDHSDATIERRDMDPPLAGAQINAVAFSPDSLVLAYATTDSKIFLWNVTDKQQPKTIAVHTGGVWSIAFSPNGNCLASGSSDNTLRISPSEDPISIPLVRPDWVSYGSRWLSCVTKKDGNSPQNIQ